MGHAGANFNQSYLKMEHDMQQWLLRLSALQSRTFDLCFGTGNNVYKLGDLILL